MGKSRGNSVGNKDASTPKEVPNSSGWFSKADIGILDILLSPGIQMIILFIWGFVIFDPIMELTRKEQTLVKNMELYKARDAVFMHTPPFTNLAVFLFGTLLEPVTRHYVTTLLAFKFLLRALSVKAVSDTSEAIFSDVWSQYVVKFIFLCYSIWTLGLIPNTVFDTITELLLLLLVSKALNQILKGVKKGHTVSDTLFIIVPLSLAFCTNFDACPILCSVLILYFTDMYNKLGKTITTMKEYLLRCGQAALISSIVPPLVFAGCISINILMHKNVVPGASTVLSPNYFVDIAGTEVIPSYKNIYYGSVIGIRSAANPSYYLSMSNEDLEPAIGSSEKFKEAKSISARMRTPDNEGYLDWVVVDMSLRSKFKDKFPLKYNVPVKLRNAKVNHYLHVHTLIFSSSCEEEVKKHPELIKPDKEVPGNSNHSWLIQRMPPNSVEKSEITTKAELVRIQNTDNRCYISTTSDPDIEDAKEIPLFCTTHPNISNNYSLWYIDYCRDLQPKSKFQNEANYRALSFFEKIKEHCTLYIRSHYYHESYAEWSRSIPVYENGLEINFSVPLNTKISPLWILLLSSLIPLSLIRIALKVLSARLVKEVSMVSPLHIESYLLVVIISCMISISNAEKSPFYYPTPLIFSMTSLAAVLMFKNILLSKFKFKMPVISLIPVIPLLAYQVVFH